MSSSRLQTFPLNGKLDLFHSWTGEPLYDYRGDLVYPQTMTYYKYPQLCLMCLASRRKPVGGNVWNGRLKPICTSGVCPQKMKQPYICIFSKKPTFTVRGLCKDAVMDTQYKFADHKPGSADYGQHQHRSYDLVDCEIGKKEQQLEILERLTLI